MARAKALRCTNGCPPERFEALNAPVFVDAQGEPLEIDDARAAYRCARCGGIALDVAAAGREMQRAHDDEGAPDTLTCPSCGTAMLPPEDDPLAELVECPMCSHRFTTDEGRASLLGDLRPAADPELN